MSTSADLGFSALDRVQRSFARQTIMSHIGASLLHASPGRVEISLSGGPHLHQQHGYIHAGALTTIMDSACGYAALTLMDLDREVLTVEYKVNFLRPASAGAFIAVGEVVRAGRTLTVAKAELRSSDEGGEILACMQATLVGVTPPTDA